MGLNKISTGFATNFILSEYAYDSEGNGISIRGIGTQKAVQYNADQAVAFYVDGVYTNDVYGLAPNLFDVERVEVARGPQGTLNGRNSIAGSVSYVNRKPTDAWDAQLLVELTDTVTQRYNAAWGGPLTDNVSFRLTGGYHEGDGWQENAGSGDGYAAPDQYTFAPQVRFTTDRFDVNVRRQTARDRGTARAPVRLVDVDRDAPTYLLGGIWPVTNYLYLYQKPLPGIANCNPAQFRDYGGLCDELENKVSEQPDQHSGQPDRPLVAERRCRCRRSLAGRRPGLADPSLHLRQHGDRHRRFAGRRQPPIACQAPRIRTRPRTVSTRSGSPSARNATCCTRIEKPRTSGTTTRVRTRCSCSPTSTARSTS